MLPDFMGFNCAPKYFYTTHASGWSNRPYISESYAQNAYPSDAYCQLLNPYATNYREFSVPLVAPYDLDITIRAMKSDGVLAGRLHMNGSNQVVTSWNFSTSGSLITYSTHIGISYFKGGMSITNIGGSSTGYYITIARN